MYLIFRVGAYVSWAWVLIQDWAIINFLPFTAIHFSKFIFHQQNKGESTLLKLYTDYYHF